jgi:hypothetical protein
LNVFILLSELKLIIRLETNSLQRWLRHYSYRESYAKIDVYFWIKIIISLGVLTRRDAAILCR